jgi:hypothetical protein
MHKLVLVFWEKSGIGVLTLIAFYVKNDISLPCVLQENLQWRSPKKFFLTGTLDDFYEEVVHFLM